MPDKSDLEKHFVIADIKKKKQAWIKKKKKQKKKQTESLRFLSHRCVTFCFLYLPLTIERRIFIIVLYHIEINNTNDITEYIKNQLKIQLNKYCTMKRSKSKQPRATYKSHKLTIDFPDILQMIILIR
jgi:hypothetical protein